MEYSVTSMPVENQLDRIKVTLPAGRSSRPGYLDHRPSVRYRDLVESLDTYLLPGLSSCAIRPLSEAVEFRHQATSLWHSAVINPLDWR